MNLILLICFESHLTKTSIYNIAIYITLNLDIVFKFEILKNYSFDKLLS